MLSIFLSCDIYLLKIWKHWVYLHDPLKFNSSEHDKHKWSNISVFMHLFNQHLMSTCVYQVLWEALGIQQGLDRNGFTFPVCHLVIITYISIVHSQYAKLFHKHCIIYSFVLEVAVIISSIWMRLLKLGNFKTEVLTDNYKYMYMLFSHKKAIYISLHLIVLSVIFQSGDKNHTVIWTGKV